MSGLPVAGAWAMIIVAVLLLIAPLVIGVGRAKAYQKYSAKPQASRRLPALAGRAALAGAKQLAERADRPEKPAASRERRGEVHVELEMRLVPCARRFRRTVAGARRAPLPRGRPRGRGLVEPRKRREAARRLSAPRTPQRSSFIARSASRPDQPRAVEKLDVRDIGGLWDAS